MMDFAESRFTGLFQRFGPIVVYPHDPQVPMWSATLPPLGPRHEALTLGGAGWDEGAARAACIGEAIERLAPYALASEQVIRASFQGFPRDEAALEPRRLVLFHEEQYAQAGFPFARFTDATECNWVAFRRIADGEAVWVPADVAFLYSAAPHRICPSVSTGLACGGAETPVLLRGLQEVIERDAVLGAWWGSYALEEWPQSEVLRRLPPWLPERVLRPHLRYRFYRADSPFSAHVTLVTLTGEDREGPLFSIGSACRETRGTSFQKALLEAIQGLHFVRYLQGKRRKGAPGARVGDALRDFPDHAVYYSLHPQRLAQTALARATAPRDERDAERVEGVAALQERLGARAVLFRDMSPPWLRALHPELRVLRVIVPGLQPLHGNADLAHLGGPLWAPRGLVAWADTPPHPFP